MGRLDGKVALITGGARGIGRDIALTFAREGARIGLLDICGEIEVAPYPPATEQELERTRADVEALGADCITAVGDVRRQSDLDELAAETVRMFGRIDIACANAGVFAFGPLLEMSEERWQELFDINVNGVWRTAKSVCAQMCEQGEGCFIATASVAGLEAEPGSGLYGTTKAAVLSLVQALALELGGHGVRANAIAPGVIRTVLGDNPALREAMFGDPNASDESFEAEMAHWAALRGVSVMPSQAIADAALWLASDEARFVTGVELPVDGGHMALPGYNPEPVLDEQPVD